MFGRENDVACVHMLRYNARVTCAECFDQSESNFNLGYFIILPEGTSCANTRRIFGILRMKNNVTQHAFKAARPFSPLPRLPLDIPIKIAIIEKNGKRAGDDGKKEKALSLQQSSKASK